MDPQKPSSSRTGSRRGSQQRPRAVSFADQQQPAPPPQPAVSEKRRKSILLEPEDDQQPKITDSGPQQQQTMDDETVNDDALIAIAALRTSRQQSLGSEADSRPSTSSNVVDEPTSGLTAYDDEDAVEDGDDDAMLFSPLATTQRHWTPPRHSGTSGDALDDVDLSSDYIERFKMKELMEYQRLFQMKEAIKQQFADMTTSVYDLLTWKDIVFDMMNSKEQDNKAVMSNVMMSDLLLLCSKIYRRAVFMHEMMGTFFRLVFTSFQIKEMHATGRKSMQYNQEDYQQEQQRPSSKEGKNNQDGYFGVVTHGGEMEDEDTLRNPIVPLGTGLFPSLDMSTQSPVDEVATQPELDVVDRAAIGVAESQAESKSPQHAQQTQTKGRDISSANAETAAKSHGIPVAMADRPTSSRVVDKSGTATAFMEAVLSSNLKPEDEAIQQQLYNEMLLQENRATLGVPPADDTASQDSGQQHNRQQQTAAVQQDNSNNSNSMDFIAFRMMMKKMKEEATKAKSLEEMCQQQQEEIKRLKLDAQSKDGTIQNLYKENQYLEEKALQSGDALAKLYEELADALIGNEQTRLTVAVVDRNNTEIISSSKYDESLNWAFRKIRESAEMLTALVQSKEAMQQFEPELQKRITVVSQQFETLRDKFDSIKAGLSNVIQDLKKESEWRVKKSQTDVSQWHQWRADFARQRDLAETIDLLKRHCNSLLESINHIVASDDALLVDEETAKKLTEELYSSVEEKKQAKVAGPKKAPQPAAKNTKDKKGTTSSLTLNIKQIMQQRTVKAMQVLMNVSQFLNEEEASIRKRRELLQTMSPSPPPSAPTTVATVSAETKKPGTAQSRATEKSKLPSSPLKKDKGLQPTTQTDATGSNKEGQAEETAQKTIARQNQISGWQVEAVADSPGPAVLPSKFSVVKNANDSTHQQQNLAPNPEVEQELRNSLARLEMQRQQERVKQALDFEKQIQEQANYLKQEFNGKIRFLKDVYEHRIDELETKLADLMRQKNTESIAWARQDAELQTSLAPTPEPVPSVAEQSIQTDEVQWQQTGVDIAISPRPPSEHERSTSHSRQYSAQSSQALEDLDDTTQKDDEEEINNEEQPPEITKDDAEQFELNDSQTISPPETLSVEVRLKTMQQDAQSYLQQIRDQFMKDLQTLRTITRPQTAVEKAPEERATPIHVQIAIREEHEAVSVVHEEKQPEIQQEQIKEEIVKEVKKDRRQSIVQQEAPAVKQDEQPPSTPPQQQQFQILRYHQLLKERQKSLQEQFKEVEDMVLEQQRVLEDISEIRTPEPDTNITASTISTVPSIEFLTPKQRDYSAFLTRQLGSTQESQKRTSPMSHSLTWDMRREKIVEEQRNKLEMALFHLNVLDEEYKMTLEQLNEVAKLDKWKNQFLESERVKLARELAAIEAQRTISQAMGYQSIGLHNIGGDMYTTQHFLSRPGTLAFPSRRAAQK